MNVIQNKSSEKQHQDPSEMCTGNPEQKETHCSLSTQGTNLHMEYLGGEKLPDVTLV